MKLWNSSLGADSTDSLKRREVPLGTSLFFMESVESAHRLRNSYSELIATRLFAFAFICTLCTFIMKNTTRDIGHDDISLTRSALSLPFLLHSSEEAFATNITCMCHRPVGGHFVDHENDETKRLPGGGGNLSFQDTGLCHSNCKSTTHKSGKLSQKNTHKSGEISQKYTHKSGEFLKIIPINPGMPKQLTYN